MLSHDTSPSTAGRVRLYTGVKNLEFQDGVFLTEVPERYETLKNDPSHQNSPVSNIEDLGALDLSEQFCCNARNGINFKISVHARILFFRFLSSYCDWCFIYV